MIEALQLCSEAERQAQFFLADQQINSVLSTSAGRLFDGISAILGICRASTFEARRRWPSSLPLRPGKKTIPHRM